MNPPPPLSAGDPRTSGFVSVVEVAGSEPADAPCHLTFDEVRELPMHLALGLDLEGDQP